jgi:hypothetical protein
VNARRALIALIVATFPGGIALSRLTAQTRGATPAVDLKMAAAEMRWRPIGPFRGGRTKAITGVPGDQNVFYMAPVNGGVWKTTDFGRTWTPIFDDQPTGSVGSITVAPSDPNIVYVGSGEGLRVRSLRRRRHLQSTDAGKTWTHLGLRDGQQIHHHRRSAKREPAHSSPCSATRIRAERGARRPPIDRRRRDVQKVLSKDENTGASDLEFDPKNPDIVYACLWEQRQGPWENCAWAGTTGGIFKSIDGGTTWRPAERGRRPKGSCRRHRRGAGRRQPDLTPPSRTTERPHLPVRRCRRELDGDHDRQPSRRRIGGGDLPVPAVDPKNCGHRDHRQHGQLSIEGRRQDVGGAARRRAATTTSARGSARSTRTSSRWPAIRARSSASTAARPGALVQPAGRRRWPRQRRQRLPYRVCGGQQESGSASRAAATTA